MRLAFSCLGPCFQLANVTGAARLNLYFLGRAQSGWVEIVHLRKRWGLDFTSGHGSPRGVWILSHFNACQPPGRARPQALRAPEAREACPEGEPGRPSHWAAMETLTADSPARAKPSPRRPRASRRPGTARGAGTGRGSRAEWARPCAVPNAAREAAGPSAAGGGVVPPDRLAPPPPPPRCCCLCTAEAGGSREISVGAVTSM